MDFIREDNTQNGIIKALDGNTEIGELTYSWSGAGRIIVDHTEIFSPYRGRGLGQKLVVAVVSFARENEIKILPLCPFVKKVMDRDPTMSDVLYTPPPQ